MNILALQLPEWLSIGTCVTFVVGFIGLLAAVIKLFTAIKQGKVASSAQVETLRAVADKLTDTNNIVPLITKVIDNIDSIVTEFQKNMDAIKKSNQDSVKFILEAFKLSNLSDENKARLNMLAAEILYPDSAEQVENLKSENQTLYQDLASKQAELAELAKKIDELTEKLTEAKKSVTPVKRTRVV